MNFSSLSGERIIAERERLKLSQALAGEYCGVSREMWGRYEKGKATMGTEVLYKFTQIGADALFILTGQRGVATPTLALNPREQALLDNYRHCDELGQDAVEKVAFIAAKPCAKPLAKTANKKI